MPDLTASSEIETRTRILFHLPVPLHHHSPFLHPFPFPGAMILTGVNNMEAFALGATFGVGFEYTVGAGVLIQTGCPFNEYNGLLMFVRAGDVFLCIPGPLTSFSFAFPILLLQPLTLMPVSLTHRIFFSRRLCLVKPLSWDRASTSEQATPVPNICPKQVRTVRYGNI